MSPFIQQTKYFSQRLRVDDMHGHVKPPPPPLKRRTADRRVKKTENSCLDVKRHQRRLAKKLRIAGLKFNEVKDG